MKNVINRALAAKKKNYNQPAVQVVQIALETIVLAGSPGQSFDFKDIDGDQW